MTLVSIFMALLPVTILVNIILIKSTLSAKEGVGISSTHSLCTDMDVLTGPRWTYNWGTESTFVTMGCNPLPKAEFVPMFWGYHNTTVYNRDDIPSDATTILGYNEPNRDKQSNLTPAEAVEGWKKMQAVFGDKILVSPSASPCGDKCVYGPPVQWFDEFFRLCNGTCKVDYLATHCYDCNATSTMAYLETLSKYKLKIWLTEFACGWQGTASEEDQNNYMSEIVPMLEESDLIAKYSWFISRTNKTNSLLTWRDYVHYNQSVLRTLGQQYDTYK